jgi:carbon monoxide dehydrogenase subunit G
MRVSGVMDVDAPVEEVFDFLADVGNEESWNPDVKSLRRVGSGPIGAGSEWDSDYRGMGRMRVRLSDVQRPRRLVFDTTGAKLDMRLVLTFASRPTGTHIDLTCDATPKGVMKLFGPLLAPLMRRTFANRPAQLTAALERRPAASN